MLITTAYKTLGKKYSLYITCEPNFSLKLQFKNIFITKKVITLRKLYFYQNIDKNVCHMTK